MTLAPRPGSGMYPSAQSVVTRITGLRIEPLCLKPEIHTLAVSKGFLRTPFLEAHASFDCGGAGVRIDSFV